MASVRKREWIHDGKRKSSWCVEYTDAGGVRRRKTPPSGSKKDADKLCAEIERQLESGGRSTNGRTPTIEGVCEQFLRHCELRLREGSIGTSRVRIMKHAIDAYIVPTLGEVPIDRLSFATADAWYDAMVRKGLSIATVKGYLLVAKMVGDFAIKRNLAKANPFTSVMHEHRGHGRSRIATFDLEQVRLILKAVENPGYKCSRRSQALLKCAVHLAAFCGLRYGEIMGLTRDQVDVTSGFLRVRHSLTVDDVLKGPKTAAGNRDVPMPAHICLLVGEWMSEWAVPETRGLVFRGPDGKMIYHVSFRATWHRLLARAGLACEGNEYHFHALRHFAASFMIEQGWPVTEVASLLGHSSFDVTLQVYAHPVVGGHRRHGMIQTFADRALVAETPPTQTRQEHAKAL